MRGKFRGVRYFFHLVGAVESEDSVGWEAVNLDDARRQAVRSVAEYLLDKPEVAWRDEEFRTEVRDAQGRLIFTVSASAHDAPDTEASPRL
jgi:hypothetical protein